METSVFCRVCVAAAAFCLVAARAGWAQTTPDPPPPTYYPAPVQASPPVTFSAAQVNFGHVPWGMQPFLLLSMSLSPAVFRPTALPRLTCSNPDVQVRLASQTVPSRPAAGARSRPAPIVQVWRLTLAARPHLGPLRGTFALVTDAHPASSEAAALRGAGLPPLSGDVTGEFTASAPNLLFGTVALGQTAARTLTLTAKTAAELRGLKATAALPCLTLTIGPPVSDGANGAHALLTVTLGKQAPTGDLHTEISVTDAHGQTLPVPVYANIGP